MSDPKLEAVVANWYPRFLANGIDFFDLRRTLDAIDGWADWADAWTADADRYEALGRTALAEGHRVTAAEHLRRAALTLQFAQFVLTEDPERRAKLQARMAALYAEAAPLLDPPAVRVSIPYGEGREVVGYLRRPPGYGIGYTVGYLQMRKLLAERRWQLGERFVLREFHDDFLSRGRLPMSLLRWEMTGLDDEVRRLWSREPIPAGD